MSIPGPTSGGRDRPATPASHARTQLAYSTLKFTFVETPLFSRLLCKYLDDEGYRHLQLALLAQPEKGDLIPGTGGFRKLRFQDGRGHRPYARRKADLETVDAIRALGQTDTTMNTKRKLFDELMQGVDAMRRERQRKVTLKTHTVEDRPPLQIDAATIRDTRESLRVSRAVFARRLRVSTRTLENWEQGRAKPNAQAAALILMVRKYPDTLKRLQALDDRAA
jgi:putative transcriptional regulator